jgi:predicted pyridoxine 5'-phosphate oxidase superfamily flavin-nucleotide-binding protein
LAFSASVKAAQTRYGAREHGARLEAAEPARDRLNDDLVAFLAGTDSFFIGTASSDGTPHVQHRGGPRGFLKALDRQTLAFADFAGNKQYITVGNLAENDRAMLLVIDYERGRRLKIWGRAKVVDGGAPGAGPRCGLSGERRAGHPHRCARLGSQLPAALSQARAQGLSG